MIAQGPHLGVNSEYSRVTSYSHGFAMTALVIGLRYFLSAPFFQVTKLSDFALTDIHLAVDLTDLVDV